MENKNKFRNYGFFALNNSNSDQKTLIVLGVARSGTSMVAGALEKLGVFMGSKKDKIVFEDIDIAKMMEKDLDTNILKEEIYQRNNKFDIWGWKRPDAIKYIHKFEYFFRNPHFIITFRDIFSIASRNMISMDFPLLAGLKKANRDYSKVIDFISNTQNPCLLISYEKAIINKNDFIEELANFSGLNPSDEQIKAAINFIKHDCATYIRTTRRTCHEGFLDRIHNGFLYGWARDKNKQTPINIDIIINDKKVCTIAADLYRKDLFSNKIGDGKHGFKVDISKFICDSKPYIVRVLISNTEYELINSPTTINGESLSESPTTNP